MYEKQTTRRLIALQNTIYHIFAVAGDANGV